jgi:hypothetical protein
MEEDPEVNAAMVEYLWGEVKSRQTHIIRAEVDLKKMREECEKMVSDVQSLEDRCVELEDINDKQLKSTDKELEESRAECERLKTKADKTNIEWSAVVEEGMNTNIQFIREADVKLKELIENCNYWKDGSNEWQRLYEQTRDSIVNINKHLENNRRKDCKTRHGAIKDECFCRVMAAGSSWCCDDAFHSWKTLMAKQSNIDNHYISITSHLLGKKIDTCDIAENTRVVDEFWKTHMIIPKILDDECSICFNSMESEEGCGDLGQVAINCGHVFHKRGLWEYWFRGNDECPLCRKEYTIDYASESRRQRPKWKTLIHEEYIPKGVMTQGRYKEFFAKHKLQKFGIEVPPC